MVGMYFHYPTFIGSDGRDILAGARKCHAETMSLAEIWASAPTCRFNLRMDDFSE